MPDRRSVSVITDPECLGPCDPGSSVILEGIVWNESRNGEFLYGYSVQHAL